MFKFQKGMAIIAILTVAAFSGCEKEKITSKEESDTKVSVQNFDKLAKFVSVLKNVPIDQVKFDDSRQEFYIPGTAFRGSLVDTQNFYEISNEYKLRYESN